VYKGKPASFIRLSHKIGRNTGSEQQCKSVIEKIVSKTFWELFAYWNTLCTIVSLLSYHGTRGESWLEGGMVVFMEFLLTCRKRSLNGSISSYALQLKRI